MGITKQKIEVFITSDGKQHYTIESAMFWEREGRLGEKLRAAGLTAQQHYQGEDVARLMLQQSSAWRQHVADILTRETGP